MDTIHIYFGNFAEMMVHVMNCHGHIIDALKLIRFYRTSYQQFHAIEPKIIIGIRHIQS